MAGTQTAVQSVYGWDSADRITTITDKNSGGTQVVSYGYSYDAASRVTQEVRTWNSGASTDSVTYGYTNNDQLTSVTHTNNGFGNENFSYDTNGNRNSSGYSTGTDNELTTDGTYNYQYDNTGNLISKTQISNGNQTLYKYDYHNRLVGADSVVAGVTMVLASYSYDALDRRIGMKEGSTTTGTLYDGASTDPLMDFVNGATTPNVRYLSGPQENLVDALLSRQNSNGVAWYLPDRLGTVRDLANNSGTIIDHVDYGAYGKVLAESGPSIGDRYVGYEGMVRDAATGLNLAVYRVQDPGTGRFLNQDPMGFNEGDANLYRYTYNSPSNFEDPSGLGLFSWILTDQWNAPQNVWDAAMESYGQAHTQAYNDTAVGSSLVLSAASFASGPAGWLAAGTNVALALMDPNVEQDDSLRLAAAPGPKGRPIIIRAPRLRAPGKVPGRGPRVAPKTGGYPKCPTGEGSVPAAERDPKRVWTKAENQGKLAEQGGRCAKCGEEVDLGTARGHHRTRHADSGNTADANHDVLCEECHKEVHRP
jgi:RHS repeat-associated protein